MSVSLSHLHPTKIITFKPYFVLQNNSRHHLLYMEENESADMWLDIAPRQVTGGRGGSGQTEIWERRKMVPGGGGGRFRCRDFLVYEFGNL